jgi:hypothetical protein
MIHSWMKYILPRTPDNPLSLGTPSKPEVVSYVHATVDDHTQKVVDGGG